MDKFFDLFQDNDSPNIEQDDNLINDIFDTNPNQQQ